MKKILFAFGTRPEAIKLAPIIKAFIDSEAFDVKVVVTAQHREMLDQVLALFEISPDYDFDLMEPGQSLTDISVKVLQKMSPILRKEKPDWLIVQGDTTTAFTSALSAGYEKIKVVHLEAGLRTGDKNEPWPEELNRMFVSVVADIHLAPTDGAKENLLKENIDPSSIYVTGNSVIDALLETVAKIETDDEISKKLNKRFDYIDSSKRLILVTGHRRENFGTRFESLCEGLKKLGNRPDVQIIYPVHLNPNVQKPVKTILGDLENVHLIEPLDYLPFVYLMHRAYLIITDSGGVQEEAPSLGKPVLVMREKTERPEAVTAGTVKLVGTDSARIVEEAGKLLDSDEMYQKMSLAHNPYGDGKTSGRIVEIIKNA